MLQRWLAAWLAILLAVAPVVSPLVPVEPAAHPGAAQQAIVAPDDVQSEQPIAGVRPAQPFTPGILSRLALLERALGLPPAQPPPLQPVGDQIMPAQRDGTGLGGEPRAILQRSSVGTARTPTGPPV